MRYRTRRTLTVALTVGVALTINGCAADTPAGTPADGDLHSASAEGDAETLGHVHGLGVDPADDTLYIASHMGVFQRTDDGRLHRVADRWQDTMGFAVLGPRHFLASGHPDLREELPPHLGLIESTDAAQSWRPLSLQGEADFHALEIAGNRTYGYDSAGERLLVTTDRKTWDTIDDIRLVDVAAHRDHPDRLLATTPTGDLLGYDLDDSVEPPAPQRLDGPPLVFLDWAEDGTLVGFAPDGGVYLSTDDAQSWQRATDVPGDAQALEAGTQRWYAATSHGIFATTNHGRSWESLVRQSGDGHDG